MPGQEKMCYIRIGSSQGKPQKVHSRSLCGAFQGIEPKKYAWLGENVLCKNWQLLGEKKILGQAHKTGSWYLLGVLFKISDEHPGIFFVWESLPRAQFVCRFVEFHTFQPDSNYATEKSLNDAKSIAWTRFSLELDTFKEFATAVLKLQPRQETFFIILSY